jgi:hypothetical protein
MKLWEGGGHLDERLRPTHLQYCAKWKPMDSKGADVNPTSGTSGISFGKGVLSTQRPSTKIPVYQILMFSEIYCKDWCFELGDPVC